MDEKTRKRAEWKQRENEDTNNEKTKMMGRKSRKNKERGKPFKMVGKGSLSKQRPIQALLISTTSCD
jgi:hypothetical protein